MPRQSSYSTSSTAVCAANLHANTPLTAMHATRTPSATPPKELSPQRGPKMWRWAMWTTPLAAARPGGCCSVTAPAARTPRREGGGGDRLAASINMTWHSACRHAASGLDMAMHAREAIHAGLPLRVVAVRHGISRPRHQLQQPTSMCFHPDQGGSVPLSALRSSTRRCSASMPGRLCGSCPRMGALQVEPQGSTMLTTR